MPRFFILLFMLVSCTSCYANEEPEQCENFNISVQVLGSGGPELTPDRASSSYLIWINHKAKVLIDAGGGSALRFGQSKANWADLQVLLFTHFHADHSSDLPALVKASWFGDRQQDMPVFGPYGNDNMPSTSEFLQELFGVKNGAFKYLSDMLDKNQDSAYKLIAHDIQDKKQTQLIFQQDGLNISAQQVIHGPIPAFAYIIQYCGKTLVFSGDTNSQGFENLKLKKTDLFIAHNAIPEDAGEIAKFLHMTPTQIGKVAKHLNTQKLILSHRMKRTLGKEQQTLKLIKQNYQGATQFADDLDVIKADN